MGRISIQWARFLRFAGKLGRPARMARDERELREILRATQERLAKVFGSVADKLGPLDGLTREVRGDCQRLLNDASGKSEGRSLLLDAASALSAPMASIDESLARGERVDRLMQDCESIAQMLLRQQNEMVAVLQPLKFMLVFFRIEASQLPPEHQSTFQSVSEEIMRLHVLVDQTFQSNISQLTDACRTIRTALNRMRKARTEDLREIDSKRASVGEAIRTLGEMLKENSLKDTDLGAAATRFEDSINRLVGSLQYEDILRQRCDAVLDCVANRPEGMSDPAWSLVLADEFETTALELRNSAGEIGASLDEIVLHAAELDEAATAMKQFDNMTVSADGMVQTLLDSFESIEGILKSNESRSAEVQGATEPVSRLAKSLSVVVVEMSLNIQFIALNAQVRSIQVGAGSGLEVLAARTAEISSVLGDLGSRTSTGIDQLESIVRELRCVVSQDRESGRAATMQLELDGAGFVAQLHQMRDGAFGTLAGIAESSDSVSALVKLDRSDLEAMSRLGDSLDSAASKLRREAGLERLSARARQGILVQVDRHAELSSRAVHTRLLERDERGLVASGYQAGL